MSECCNNDLRESYTVLNDTTVTSKVKLVGKGCPGTWTAAAIAVGHTGSYRAPIPKGNISYADLLSVIPFGRTIDTVEIQGSALLEALEDSMGSGFLLHWSGLRVVFDASQEQGRRVVKATVRCHKCPVPTYAPIDKDTWYPVATNSYILENARFFPGLNKFRNRRVGPKDVDVLKEYLSQRKAIYKELDDRLVILNGQNRLKMFADLRAGRRQPSGEGFSWLQ